MKELLILSLSAQVQTQMEFSKELANEEGGKGPSGYRAWKALEQSK